MNQFPGKGMASISDVASAGSSVLSTCSHNSVGIRSSAVFVESPGNLLEGRLMRTIVAEESSRASLCRCRVGYMANARQSNSPTPRYRHIIINSSAGRFSKTFPRCGGGGGGGGGGGAPAADIVVYLLSRNTSQVSRLHFPNKCYNLTMSGRSQALLFE
jgi:hypothetical protein